MTRTLDIRNPRTGEYDYSLEVTSASDLERTITQLRHAQKTWAAAGLAYRIEILQRFAAALETHRKDLQDALTIDTGRYMISTQEISGLISSIERWCQLAPNAETLGEHTSKAMPHIALQQRRVAFPVVGAISPWNFPLLLSFIDAIPALLAGCSVVIKPSEVTPRFAEPLDRIVATIPPLKNVLAFVHGDGQVGAELIKHIDAVAFTGSVATGRKVAASAAAEFIPAFLELGGKDPAIVLPGADLERAASAILRASVVATGQACQSLERVYVSQSDYGAFTDLLTASAEQLELNYPDIHSGTVGPLIFDRQAEIIRTHIQNALDLGAQCRCGGDILTLGGGSWIRPTVLTDVNHSMMVMQEETFGPVIPVMAFEDLNTAVTLANDSQYGLSGAVFAATEAEAIAVGERLTVGGVSINDAGLTSMVFEEQKSAFGYSGLGPSRMGASGYLRFLRQQALYLNRGDVLPISALAER